MAAEPGLIQLWTGLFVESTEDWSILIRPPANLPRNQGYELYEGIVESDRWFGPLFTNLRLVKTDVPIVFNTGCAVTSGKESAGTYAKDKEIPRSERRIRRR